MRIAITETTTATTTMIEPARPPSATAQRPPRRTGGRAQGVRGVKLLISSLALVTTLAGWARLANGKYAPAGGAAGGAAGLATPWAIVASTNDARAIPYRVEALPTLVPLIEPPREDTRRAVGPAAAAPVSASDAPSLTSLRHVSAPPPPPAPSPQEQAQDRRREPVAVTRSSR